jgi:hypothetical protein
MRSQPEMFPFGEPIWSISRQRWLHRLNDANIVCKLHPVMISGILVFLGGFGCSLFGLRECTFECSWLGLHFNIVGLELRRGPAKAGPGETYSVLIGVGVVLLKNATPKVGEIRSGMDLCLVIKDG